MHRTILLIAIALLAGCLSDAPPPNASNEVPLLTSGLAPLWPDAAWTQLAPDPTYRTENAIAIADGRLYSLTGMTNESTAVALSEMYDIAADTWTKIADYPISTNHMLAAGVGTKVYAFGGLAEAAAVNLGFSYDPAAGRWSPLPPMPSPRAAGVAVAIGSKIYLVAGYSAPGQHLTETHVFDTTTNLWSIEPGPITPRDHTGATTLDGKIYLVAGDVNGHGSNTKSTEVYDPATKTWKKLADVPTLRGSDVALPFRGHIVAMGGQNATGVFDDVEAYDPTTDAWTVLPPLSRPRHGFGGAEWHGVLYISGGGHEPGSLPGQQTTNSIEALGN